MAEEQIAQETDREQIINQIADWIDTQVIAEMIVEHLEETDRPVTVQEAQTVWYGTLENLGGGVGLAI
jgi:hypothetical protein